MVLKVKLRSSGKKLTPYISAVATDGDIQKRFAIGIGNPVGSCVKGAVHKGMTASEIRKAVSTCAKAKAGTTI